MHRAEARLRVPGHDAELTVVRHGHYGRPLLAFPSEGGSAGDFEGNGMLDAIRDLVDAGRVSVFAVDSMDGWTWSANDIPTDERAARHSALSLLDRAGRRPVDRRTDRRGTRPHHLRRLAGRLPRSAVRVPARRPRDAGHGVLRQLRPDDVELVGRPR